MYNLYCWILRYIRVVTNLKDIHTETCLAVYVKIFYSIAVSSRTIRHFGSLELLFCFKRVTEWMNLKTTPVYSQSIYFFKTMFSSPQRAKFRHKLQIFSVLASCGCGFNFIVIVQYHCHSLSQFIGGKTKYSETDFELEADVLWRQWQFMEPLDSSILEVTKRMELRLNRPTAVNC